MESLKMLADFLLIGGMTLLAIVIFILLKSKKGFSHNLLSIVFASCFFFILYYYAFLHRSAVFASIAVAFGYGMGFLLGPILLAYIQSISLPKKEVLKPLLIRLIPFFSFWLLISVPMALNLFNRTWFTSYAKLIADYADYLNIIENLYLLGFMWYSANQINNYKITLKDHYSNLDKRDLAWCKLLLKGLGVIIVLDIGLSIYELVFPPTEIIWNVGLIIAFSMVGFYTYLGYRGIFQEKVFIPAFLMEPRQVSHLQERPESNSPSTEGEPQMAKLHYLGGLSTRELETLKETLHSLLENEKLYTNEKLTLSDLAMRMDITDKKLSEFLNQSLDMSFYDMINAYRVNEVKQRISDSKFEHYTLLGIALESGFQSKSSFNRVFKNKTGMSPSEYKRSVSSELLNVAG